LQNQQKAVLALAPWHHNNKEWFILNVMVPKQPRPADVSVIQMTLRQFKRGLSKICLNDHANT
jgi:hypothetical protein